jgi:hypothetical protein
MGVIYFCGYQNDIPLLGKWMSLPIKNSDKSEESCEM